MTFRAGIVGCGRIGSEFDEQGIPTHAGSYAATQGIELVALSDLERSKLEKAGKRWGIDRLYQDYREMLRAENLDILSVATKASSHLEIVSESVNSGVKALYCEKPIADTLANADEIIRLCYEQGVKLQINHQRRFDHLYRQLKDFVQEGGLGEVQQVTFDYNRGVANTGSHMFDLLLFFFGDVDEVEATYSQHKSHDANDPNIDGIVKFKSGVNAIITASEDQSATAFAMKITGLRGRLDIMSNATVIEYYERKEGAWQSSVLPFNPSNTSIPRNSMAQAVEHLIACLKVGKESVSNGNDGRVALELICAFHESADDNGRMIKLPLSKSNVII